MKPRRAYSSDATSFLESNRRRTFTFWKAPAVFTPLMTVAGWISWLLASGTVSFVREGTVSLYVPVGPDRPLILADVARMPVGFLLHALILAMPIFLACLIFLFPLRLADGNTIISRPVFWRIYVSGLGALGGLFAFLAFDSAPEPIRIAFTLESAPLYVSVAAAFAGIHLIAGHIGARWLIWSAGLFDARHVREF